MTSTKHGQHCVRNMRWNARISSCNINHVLRPPSKPRPAAAVCNNCRTVSVLSTPRTSLQRASKNCKHFVNVVMHEEIPKMKGRLHAAAELRSKREAAIIEAETKYQQMDPRQLIALLQLDKKAVQIRKGSILTKQVTVTKGSELAALVKQFPDLETFFDVKHVDPSSSPTAQPKLMSARTRIPTPHPSRSARRPKSQTSLRGTSHGKSPRSSSRRPSKGKGKSRNDGCVGKGQGKGKGKKGKGRAASGKRVSWGQAS